MFPSPYNISCLWRAVCVKRNICGQRNKLWTTCRVAQDRRCGYVDNSRDADAVPLSNRWDKAEIAAEDDPQVDALLDALSEFDAPLYEYGVGLFNETLALCKCCDSRVVKENLPEEAQAGAPP